MPWDEHVINDDIVVKMETNKDGQRYYNQKETIKKNYGTRKVELFKPGEIEQKGG